MDSIMYRVYLKVASQRATMCAQSYQFQPNLTLEKNKNVLPKVLLAYKYRVFLGAN